MVFKKIVFTCTFFRNERVLVGITLDGGVWTHLHVGVNLSPLIVLCRRLLLCYGKNRLFMQKNAIFKKIPEHAFFFRNERVWVGITISGGVWIHPHVGVNLSPLIVLCRRLLFFMLKSRHSLTEYSMFVSFRITRSKKIKKIVMRSVTRRFCMA